MSKAYVIETGDEAAGIVVREGDRFRFYSSSRRFRTLDGASCRKPRDAERAAARVAVIASGPRSSSFPVAMRSR